MCSKFTLFAMQFKSKFSLSFKPEAFKEFKALYVFTIRPGILKLSSKDFYLLDLKRDYLIKEALFGANYCY